MPKKSSGAADSRFNVEAIEQKERSLKSRVGDGLPPADSENDFSGSDVEVVIDDNASESGEIDESEESDGEEDGEGIRSDASDREGDDYREEVSGGESDGSVENEQYDTDNDAGEQDQQQAAGRVRGKKKKVRGVLSREELQRFKDQAEQTGVIYISRIPPFMKPIKLRHYFSAYGTVGRIYLQAEDALARKKRQRMGGNKKKKFTEGWVEFLNKRDAKLVARTLNNQPVGGRKRSYYAYDLWNIKYLPKFKWHHLTERIAYENAVREKKLQLAVRQATRENNFYLENVDKSRMIRDIEARKKAKRPAGEDADVPVLRTFKQRPMLNATQPKKKHKPSEDAQ